MALCYKHNAAERLFNMHDRPYIAGGKLAIFPIMRETPSGEGGVGGSHVPWSWKQ